MQTDQNKLLMVTTDESDGPTWETGPVFQLACYLGEILEGADFEVIGVYELDMTTGGAVQRLRYEVGPASGNTDVNPNDKLLTIWYANGEIEEFAFEINP